MSISFVKKLVLMILGLFLLSAGILLTIHSRLGAGSWELFQIGITNRTRFTLGQVSQIVGAVIILIDIAMKQFPGWGTVLNMYFVGFFIDLIDGFSVMPHPQSLFGRVSTLLAGIFVVAWGTFFYLDAGWGAGPRDGLMLGLSKLLSTKVWIARTGIEVCVVGAACCLGVMPGLGTVLTALLVGPMLQTAYRMVGKEPETVKHKTLVDTYTSLALLKKKDFVEPEV